MYLPGTDPGGWGHGGPCKSPNTFSRGACLQTPPSGSIYIYTTCSIISEQEVDDEGECNRTIDESGAVHVSTHI